MWVIYNHYRLGSNVLLAWMFSRHSLAASSALTRVLGWAHNGGSAFCR